jgi:choline dehydrogenase-like flavoprotein
MMDNIVMNNGEYVLEDIHSIPVGIGVKYPASFPSIGNALWGLTFKQKMRDVEKKLLGIAIMGKSPSGANITVSNSGGNAQVSSTAYQPPTGSIAAAKSIITALGGEVATTPWDRDGMAATVHPTGGCAMGQIVDTSTLQVYNNAGLHVIDGSVFPSSSWRNPSHTIAAVAEKALATLLGTPPAW